MSDRPKHVAQSRSRVVFEVCHDPDTPEKKYLLVRVEIYCEDCGAPQGYMVVGHHVPMMIHAFQKALAQYPELCKETVTEIPSGSNLVMPPTGGRTM